jgi:putative FmdB family regulatory protein
VPLYDFRCRNCGEPFEEFAPPAQSAPCPACGSDDVERMLTGFVGPFTTAPRGVAARRSNAQRRVREELRAERRAEREAQRREQGQ